MHGQDRLDLKINYRQCRQEDLLDLEWFGMFYEHRNIILEQFSRHQKGHNHMIVAEVNSFPVGQVWIDIEKKKREKTGIIWALRVLQPFQNLGIGSELIRISEEYLKRINYSTAEICVLKDNEQAKKLYERIGYRLICEVTEEYSYLTPSGVLITGISEEWMLQKKLNSIKAVNTKHSSTKTEAA